jgi:hypothetical protein
MRQHLLREALLETAKVISQNGNSFPLKCMNTQHLNPLTHTYMHTKSAMIPIPQSKNHSVHTEPALLWMQRKLVYNTHKDRCGHHN